jgi:hypothetical protein
MIGTACGTLVHYATPGQLGANCWGDRKMDAGDISSDAVALARSNNWTIKNVSLETRMRAVNAAKLAGVSVAAWLAQAVDLLAERQGNNAILPPTESPRPPATKPALTPDEVVRYVHAYRDYLALRGAVWPARGQVMQAADRLMAEAMTAAGMRPPERLRRLPAPDHEIASATSRRERDTGT